MAKSAELRSLSSPEFDVRTGQPADPDNFCVLIEAEIGIRGEAGADLFHFHVCSPMWLAAELQNGRYEWGRRHLFVERWDYQVVQAAVRRLAERQGVDEWSKLVGRLSSWLAWEYEDYKDPSPIE